MTLQFPSQMPATRSLGRGRWLLLEDWTFTLNGVGHTIPKGFITDLYSVPWFFTLFFSRDESDNRPALIHDWLFATLGLRPTALLPSLFTLAECNQVLQAAMSLCHLPRLARWAIYRGVETGSFLVWRALKAKGYSIANPCID